MHLVHPTFSELCSQPPHRSFWRRRLSERAGGEDLEDWLIEQANLRGFRGAGVVRVQPSSIDPSISLEDIVVGLLAPQARVDGRVFKLVLRMIQSGSVAPTRLWWLARKEKADAVLFWLLGMVPEVERTLHVRSVMAVSKEPRGYRPPSYRFDPARLIRRPARKESLWKTTRH